MTVTVVVSVRLPLVALTVMVWVPVDAFLEVATVIFEVPEPVMEVGLKLPVTSVGIPVADKATLESKPPETEMVTTAYPLWPRSR